MYIILILCKESNIAFQKSTNQEIKINFRVFLMDRFKKKVSCKSIHQFWRFKKPVGKTGFK